MPRRRRHSHLSRYRKPRSARKKKVSFASDLWLSEGSKADWPYFARWHYRGHGLGFVKRVVLLWHGDEPIGIGIFASPAASLKLRTAYFGLHHPRSPVMLQRINQSLWVLSRVVLHPAYRGAGIAADFIARACDSCPVPWVETLSAMGQINPFFERAGFTRVGIVRKDGRGKPNCAYGGSRSRKCVDSDDRNRFSEPVYYIRKRKCDQT